ncbi:MAG: hypothetical protein IPO50_12970 [Sphingomonadales bacterium]|nr:hypothetical protein [Sphingomonadales bacterium]
MPRFVVISLAGLAGALEISVQTKIVRSAHGADRKLALRITAILMGLAIAVIIGAVYAGIAMNSAALEIESGIIEKELDRIVVKTLDEQKAWPCGMSPWSASPGMTWPGSTRKSAAISQAPMDMI